MLWPSAFPILFLNSNRLYRVYTGHMPTDKYAGEGAAI
jgi:hypothetical protein